MGSPGSYRLPHATSTFGQGYCWCNDLGHTNLAYKQATTGANCLGLDHGYDVWGNLLSISKKTDTHSACAPTLLTLGVNTKNQISDPGFVYDAAGNLTNTPNPGGLAMQYDAENRMTSAAGVTYTYDGDGKRVMKSTAGMPPQPFKLYWFGMSSDPLFESDAAGTVSDEYIFFVGKRTARRHINPTPPHTITYYFSDHLGSSRVVTSDSGSVLDDSDFYPFGKEVPFLASTDNPYLFTGKERDSESGLDFFIARYYSSQYGRFFIPDWAGAPTTVPYANFGDPQSLNLYTYVGNNPVLQSDPDGHICRSVGECVTTVQNAVDRATNKIIEAASNSGSETLAGGVTFVAGMHRDLTNGTLDAFKAGEAVGACVDSCNGTQLADAASQDLMRTSQLVSMAAGPGEAVAQKLGATVPAPVPASAPGPAPTPTQGIYEFTDESAPGRTYVGQSGNIPQRLAQHESTGRLAPGTQVSATPVGGGRIAREVAEQGRINELGGVRSVPGSQTSNVRNPIGPQRQHLLREEKPQ